MATAATSSSLCSSEEKTNGFKLMRLIIDGGTEALRYVFKAKHPGDLQMVLFSYHLTLLKLRKIITPPQWEKLFPPVPMIPNINEFDITLLFLLLRNICGMSAPIGTGWNNMPSNTDISLEANIVRIKLFRNKFFGHVPDTGVSTMEFEARWKEVSTTLVNLGISQLEIDRLKDEECGQEDVDRIRSEWSENKNKFELELTEIKEMLTEDRKRLLDIQSDDDVINKHLEWCDFSCDIEVFYQKWCKDTREWVFAQVNEWFNDTTSANRAFIITGQAGMGKSVIAAVICKRFAKQLAACHFCQYNNDRYNKPKILLQSLAKQLSNALPDYKKRIVEKLSGKEGRRVDDMNIQGLFSLLFKEPLTGIDVAEKLLIVIDAVDESECEGKSDLVDLIADYLWKLPTFFRFLITSRPENYISKKFQKLNPMFLSPNDDQNVKDIQRLFEEKSSHSIDVQHIGRLVEKSEGLMLFANCLYEILDDCSINLDIDNIPTQIEGIYSSYFKRWENEFHVAKVREDVFLSFLSVMAVAKEPLPETLVARVFDSENKSPAIAKRKINEIKNCLSSLLVNHQDRLTFFHKSVKDWLVECKHKFTVDERYGHEALANICAREMDELKKNEIKQSFSSSAEYALLYGIQHKLSGTQDGSLNTFMDRYVTDLEIMYSSINVNVYVTFNNVNCLIKSDIYSSVPEETRKIIETLMLLIRKYNNVFEDSPQSFLQHVVNWGGDELSLKATSLLNSRYKDLVYFECIQKDAFENSLVGRIYASDKIISVDVSPSEDYVICNYSKNSVELFSLVDLMPLWIIEIVKVPLPRFYAAYGFRPIVFHPLKNVILPSRLDIVINLQGELEPGPFSCNNVNPRFQNCCFSNDNSKMATTYKNDLTVWDLVNSEKLKSFSSDEELVSISFSANGMFLATSDEGKRVVVYDLERGYISISKSFDQLLTFTSTFNSDSWYCVSLSRDLYSVRSDLAAVNIVGRAKEVGPLNAEAVSEFQEFLKDETKSWLKEFRHIGFFCLTRSIVLVWDKYMHLMNVFRYSKLKETPLVKDNPKSLINSKKDFDISVDGKFIYTTNWKNLIVGKLDSNCSIHLSSSIKWPEIPFVPVTNGVFFCGKLDDSRDWIANRRFQNNIPELWNSDLAERLGRFPELSGTRKCLSVSEEIVACIMASQVCFFNVIKRKIVSRTHIPRNNEVMACSRKYHVLMHMRTKLRSSLWRDGAVVAEWENIDSILTNAVLNPFFTLKKSYFSPSSETFALSVVNDKAVYIFDVPRASVLRKVDFEFFRHKDNKNPLGFLDEGKLFCRAYQSSVCLIDVASGIVLTCIDVRGEPESLRVSCKPDNGFVLLCVRTRREEIKLFKVWLPR